MKKAVALIAVAALVLGTIMGALLFFQQLLSSDDSPERPLQEQGSSAADVIEPPSPELASYYSQQISWEECGTGFECGWLKVPQDYAAPEGKQLDLLLLKTLAKKPDQRIGSLVVNPGGPGAPGTTYAAQAAFAFGDPVLSHFDIVGFDPRGTGRSNPVDCLSDDDVDAYLKADPAPTTDAEVAEVVAWNKKFAQGCREKSGDLVNHVSTVEAAKDMDVLRAALGQERLDYFGASYGTQLGATYAELFPERVGHFVLDGGVDVSASERDKSLVQAGGFETALRAYIQDCVDQGECQLGDSVETGLETLTDLVDRVDAQPMKAGGGRELGAGNAFYGIVMPLYNRDYWPMLDAALEKALANDGSGLLQLADLYSSRGPNGYTDNSVEAIAAIRCLDDPSFVPAEQVPDDFADFEEASPTFGRVFAWGQLGCQFFDQDVPEPIEIDGAGAAPIVVTGTTRDPATPMVWAEALAEQLESGVLIRRDGDGHTAYNAGNACVDEAIESYLVDGKVPEDGLSC
ncbi:alpha/beta hydrolase [Nocardioides gilvus]|uniref:alpha/beta hydrolase n=1 Tax=Nocardioides gilvus TaxID=1735589 RepID=UPI000D74D466|nr:alpha/beta hydrolase [Nocardioides gilvus]